MLPAPLSPAPVKPTIPIPCHDLARASTNTRHREGEEKGHRGGRVGEALPPVDLGGNREAITGNAKDQGPAPHRLNGGSLRLAVHDCIREGLKLHDIFATLYREDPADIVPLYDTAFLAVACVFRDPDGTHGLHAERIEQLRRPLPYRLKEGMTVGAMALKAGVSRETLARYLERHGFLTMAPYGGRQRRRVVSDEAFEAEYGHTVDASKVRVGHLEGMNRAVPFPVFYPEHVPNILWTLGLDVIREEMARLPSKRARLTWLLDNHPDLTSQEAANFAGCTERAVKKAKARRGTVSSSSIVEDPLSVQITHGGTFMRTEEGWSSSGSSTLAGP